VVRVNNVRPKRQSRRLIYHEVATRAHLLRERSELGCENNRPVPASPQSISKLLDYDLGTRSAGQANIRDENCPRHNSIFLGVESTRLIEYDPVAGRLSSLSATISLSIEGKSRKPALLIVSRRGGRMFCGVNRKPASFSSLPDLTQCGSEAPYLGGDQWLVREGRASRRPACGSNCRC
jgi:hypothetical protein